MILSRTVFLSCHTSLFKASSPFLCFYIKPSLFEEMLLWYIIFIILFSLLIYESSLSQLPSGDIVSKERVNYCNHRRYVSITICWKTIALFIGWNSTRIMNWGGQQPYRHEPPGCLRAGWEMLFLVEKLTRINEPKLKVNSVNEEKWAELLPRSHSLFLWKPFQALWDAACPADALTSWTRRKKNSRKTEETLR